MAISKTWMLPVKVLMLSTAVISAALAFKQSLPFLREFFISAVPQIWSSVLSWLTPPYLYFVINGIIISILASSKFQQSKAEESHNKPGASAVVRTDFEVPTDHYEAVVLKTPVEIRPDHLREADQAPYTRFPAYQKAEERREEEQLEDDFVISRSDWNPRRRGDATELSMPTEKPLVSVRFGHRKSVKASPEGNRPLGVARSKRHETLESTWKMITDGRAMPLARHLKKSDTWETVHARVPAPDPPEMKKSETVKEHRHSHPKQVQSPSVSPGLGGRVLLRKESSLGQDELNRRVEAFINKFNEEMRLQRQESWKHYKEMINRGSH